VRLGICLLVAVMAVALVACSSSGDDDEAAAPLPVAQRFLTAEDAPGSKPDPVETRQTTVDFDEVITAVSEFAFNPDVEELTTVLEEAGVKQAGRDTRFFAETHSQDAPHTSSSFIELESEDGATSALDWLETDSRKPCPMSCAVQISDFDVADIPNARGVRRLTTAEDIARVGTPDQRPLDSYWVGFVIGALAYTVDLRGPPGSVSEEQALEIASAYYDRLTAS
jgi:hypothetical protein